MNYQKYLAIIIPKAGLTHLKATYLTWAGVGFIGSYVATALDEYAEVAYAAYYTNAVNDAVGYKFWILLSVIGLLLLCVNLPLVYLAEHLKRFEKVATRLRQLTYTFFVVAFDEGALMIGILVANFFHASEKASLLASKSFLFSDIGFLALVGLCLANTLLWLLGEALYNHNDQQVSGVIDWLIKTPLKYALPAYLVMSGLFVHLITHQ
ncbi:MxaP protein [Methylicorpusculum oleiharenae]|uniref:MxaP protein n=1 Tax=Methylicorpusculum oleiharenae TaxID=1338687 RepID=UPI00135A1DA9|nr:MxaP protein [Methylicorpusculum oleiharenae]MCD2452727.1 MxaP protein [Methylicorpusculum oleiharenae]